MLFLRLNDVPCSFLRNFCLSDLHTIFYDLNNKSVYDTGKTCVSGLSFGFRFCSMELFVL